ncbi:glycosyltransferase family 4 protein [Streptomyces aidingensis]|uniref:D-inositol 3-phosphate glycosyltransferase n=1 Tax=Streptomyces aidingensis TaxID=910347 RepID=A0A1I1HNG9_9ACTN|nr:glycosyltransferase family 4 protein [Streptomyces aidingensis]SFC25659.1 Glycosyltransferase involved in cell wall bisynthesis [Streptomyces aidingensis]
MKIAFLVYNMYGIGGTVRAVANLASGLSAHHDVEIVSVFRRGDAPRFPLDPRVRLVPLIDARHRLWRWTHPSARRSSAMFHDPGPAGGAVPPSRLVDRRVAAYLRRTRADAVIATRPLLVGHLAAYGPDRCLRIGQEHRTLDSHNPELREQMLAAVSCLDAYVTVSEADARAWRAALPAGSGATVTALPNAVPAPDPELRLPGPDQDSRLVVAVGRLIPIKRFDRLIEAFAKVVTVRPDWELRIYGRGRTEGRLRRTIDALGLGDRVRLMGAVAPVESEWAKAAVAAVASDGESFGMTIVEAMRCGVPVVSTDCPYGPAEIITPGVDGLLVPLEGGSDALADALLELIEDPGRRRAMGEAGLRTGARYDPAGLAERWTGLLHDLARRRPGGCAVRRPGGLSAAVAGAAFDAGELAARTAARLAAVRRRARRPRPAAARCTVTEDGSLLIAFEDIPASAASAGAPLDLVLRLRGTPTTLRLPLTEQQPGGRPAALLSRAHHILGEGRWDCRLAPRGTPPGTPAEAAGPPVAARLLDTAPLLTLPPTVDQRGLRHWVPYATADGTLAVRAWLRHAHAEIEQVLPGESGFTVTARVLAPAGRAPGPRPRVLLGPDWDVAVRTVAGAPDRLEFSVDYAEALRHRTAGPDTVAELRYRPGPGRGTVSLGRIGGDIPDRRRTDRYPAVVLRHPEYGPTRLRPVFTHRNALALAMTDAPAAPAASAGR